MSDFYDGANLELHALNLRESSAAWLASQHLLVVVLVILCTPLAILNLVLDHGDKNDESQWQQREERTVWLSNTRHYLQQDQEHEVSIDYFEQLKEQILGKEVAFCVACCGDQVVWEVSIHLFRCKARIELEDSP